MNSMLICLLLACSLSSCNQEEIAYKQGDIKVSIEQGEEWLHDFPLFLGIHKKNPPQLAIWVEDTEGNYVATAYVTHKIATQSWMAAKGNRRKEALPHWCYSRGIVYQDGLYLPTKNEPLTDALSGATPRGSFAIRLAPVSLIHQIVVKIEINHSTDFNDSYPKAAKEGDAHYSGGKEGSGQPAVVYAAKVDLSFGKNVVEAELIGHSSPDGSSGKIDKDLSGLTTALHIVKRITIHIQ